MKRNGIRKARLAEAGAHITGEFARKIGFQKDADTGEYFFVAKPPRAVESATW